jgi:hypothetical protein
MRPGPPVVNAKGIGVCRRRVYSGLERVRLGETVTGEAKDSPVVHFN